MLHIFRCAGVNHVEVTNEEPYLLPGADHFVMNATG